MEPLPLEVVVSLYGHGSSPVSFSPDGQWLAHTIATDETVARGASRAYTATGVPLLDGNARLQATLSSTDGERQVTLGDTLSSSWAPVWSPSGDRVAFFSDADGEAGLWVRDVSSGESRRVGDFIVRPAFGFETARWSNDGTRVLVEVLPPGVSIEDANAHSSADTDRHGSESPPTGLSVIVRRSTGSDADVADAAAAEDADGGGFTATYIADLVVVDPTTAEVERVVERTRIGWYEFSPGDRYIAYTASAGQDPVRQQSFSDLRVVELATGKDRLVAAGVPFAYAVEWSWSPQGDRIAYVRSGVSADGGVVIVPLDESSALVESSRAGFDPNTGDYRPVWSRDGSALYAVADHAVWRIDAATGAATELARVDGWRIRSMITESFLSPVAWSRDDGRTVWVTAREADGANAGLIAVEAATGRTRLVQRQHRTLGSGLSLAASAASGRIVVAAADQHNPAELWLLDPDSGEMTQASRINRSLGEYALGSTRLIHWHGTDGEARSGALLLPPGYRSCTRVPLVVWVYGGMNGAAAANRFGLWSSAPAFNLQVLATRGYAVLFPDAPLRVGHVIDDLVAAVLPGVDAAIEQGFADADRLAIMGQSFGALNVLSILTRTSRFRAAVITAAVLHPDLVADYLVRPGLYEVGQGRMGGSIWEYPDRYRDNSPIFDFPRITTPLLIGMGSLDGNQVAAEAIFTALERLGRPVEYRVYEGEGHVIAGRASVVDFWTRRLDFLAEHLGSAAGHAHRCEPRSSPSDTRTTTQGDDA